MVLERFVIATHQREHPYNSFQSHTYDLKKKEALQVTHTTDEGQIVLTDRSRLEHERVRCAIVWKEGEEKWKGEWYCIEKKKEVYS